MLFACPPRPGKGVTLQTPRPYATMRVIESKGPVDHENTTACPAYVPDAAVGMRRLFRRGGSGRGRNFWEPWCGPCVGEMADLQRLQDTYAERGLLILGVYQTADAEEDVDAVLSQTGVTYPILHYTQEFDAFQSGYVPTTIFVDGEGRLIGEGSSALYIGSNSFEGWAAVVEDLL